MSIPADFRRVLEAGDPKCPENPNPRLVLLYGPHLKNCLHVYTIEAMAEIEEDIQKLPRGSAERRTASRMILGRAWETEVDKDGRIVLPKDRRIQIGLAETGGETMMVAMGDYFELWNSETYEREVSAEMDAFLAEQDDDFDPLSLLGGA
ncbi:division/cell wall cluster transcriptional repressor MraZ [Primorskyibacter sp. S187A]|uniref:division/cell wall cluster transcriptional repressor MraZ n=1 Tax=Primorskyibacter sp. S187A TaxID=3415130 RepID=UPI003C7C6AE4